MVPDIELGAGRSAPGRGGSKARCGRAPWCPQGKVAGRYLVLYGRPRDRRYSQRGRSSTSAPPPGANQAEDEAVLELPLLLAQEDAAAGDTAQALQALDAAAALSGGILPAGYADRRAAWREWLNHDDRVGH